MRSARGRHRRRTHRPQPSQKPIRGRRASRIRRSGPLSTQRAGAPAGENAAGLDLFELATGHDAMILGPDALTEMLMRGMRSRGNDGFELTLRYPLYGSSGTPMRLISHSSATPVVSKTRRLTSSPRASRSPAVAWPVLMRKLQCMVDT